MSNSCGYVLSCESTADLTKEHFEDRDIHLVYFYYLLDGVEYPDDLGQSMPFDKFYRAMVDGADTKTSQPSVEQYVDTFVPFLEEGKDILHVSLSSGISGAYNAASLAADELMKRYPERTVHVVDSLGASSGYGLLMDKLADKRDEGLTVDELKEWAEANRLKVHHWFFSTDLTFYIKGGRVSKTSGLIGTALKICPLLNMDNLGRLIPRKKIPAKKRTIRETLERMKEHARGGLDYAGKCYISNSACYEDARTVADMVEATFPHLDGKVEIYSVGTTIGSHTGPGTVALFFWGDERVD